MLECICVHLKFIVITELNQLTGIAAILRFPMPELEDSDADEEDSSSDCE